MASNLAPEGAIQSIAPSPSAQSLLNQLHRIQSRLQSHSQLSPAHACRTAAANASIHQPSPSPPHLSSQISPPSDHTPEAPCKRMRVPPSNTHSSPPITQQHHKLPQNPSTEKLLPEHSNHLQHLRTQIQNVDHDAKIPLCQNNLITPYRREKMLQLHKNIKHLFQIQYDRLDREGNILTEQDVRQQSVQEQGRLGCKHYARNCKLKAKCCGLFVSCRLCHDELLSEDHEIDRFATETVLCMVCLTEQDVAPSCIKCNASFAHYFCKHCRFYENTPGKDVYHCPRCNICRLGKGLDIDNYHCDKCDACVSMQSKAHHQCMREALHQDCPVCRVYLFTSTEPVVYMRCGHAMHKKCFDEYTLKSYQCPLCMRSLTDTDDFFERIDKLVRSEPMPPEYSNKRSMILCNDCTKKGEVPYHFVYHKCAAGCGSYNTTVLDSYDVEPDPEIADTEPVDQAPAAQLVAGMVDYCTRPAGHH